MDLVLLVDSSGSICNDEIVNTCENWELVKEFLGRVIGELLVSENNTHVALVRFASETDLIFGLNRFEILMKFLIHVVWVLVENTQ